MDSLVILSISEGFHLGRGKDRIAYAGMPADSVYSIVQIKNAFLTTHSLGICIIPRVKVK